MKISKDEECYKSYKKLYEKLSKELNKPGLCKKVTVLSETLSYDRFKNEKCIKEKKVRDFYFGE